MARDYTGSQKAKLAAQFAQQQALRAREMSLVSEIVAENHNEPIDLTPDFEDARTPWLKQAEDSDEIVVDEETLHPIDEPVKFRCGETSEAVTLGKDHTFSLEEGQEYIVPRWVYDHLDEKDLVRH